MGQAAEAGACDHRVASKRQLRAEPWGGSCDPPRWRVSLVPGRETAHAQPIRARARKMGEVLPDTARWRQGRRLGRTESRDCQPPLMQESAKGSLPRPPPKERAGGRRRGSLALERTAHRGAAVDEGRGLHSTANSANAAVPPPRNQRRRGRDGGRAPPLRALTTQRRGRRLPKNTPEAGGANLGTGLLGTECSCSPDTGQQAR